MPQTSNGNLKAIFAWKNLIKFWIAAAIVGIFVLGVAKVSSILFLVLIAYVLSIALDSFIEGFSVLFKSRGLAIAVVYILFLLLLVSGVLIIVPFVIDQVSSLFKGIISSISHFQQLVQQK